MQSLLKNAAMSLVVGCGLNLATDARADVVLPAMADNEWVAYNSLNAPVTPNGTYYAERGEGVSTSGGRRGLAQQFLVTSAQGAYISAISLMMLDNGGNSSSTVDVGIYNDSGNKPGTLIGNFTGQVPGSLNDNSFQLTTFKNADSLHTIHTGAGAYWVVIKPTIDNVDAFSSIRVQDNLSTTNTYLHSGFGYSTREMVLNTSGGWSSTTGTHPLMMEITAVPEASQWAMMGITVMGAGGFYLRRRQAGQLPVQV